MDYNGKWKTITEFDGTTVILITDLLIAAQTQSSKWHFANVSI